MSFTSVAMRGCTLAQGRLPKDWKGANTMRTSMPTARTIRRKVSR